ncbi:unnamed protein product, partial [marine sediment metagenome]
GEVDILSQPIRDEEQTTSGGYWLIKTLGSEVREVSDEDRDLLVAKALEKWRLALLDDPANEVVIYLDDELKEFAARKAVG